MRFQRIMSSADNCTSCSTNRGIKEFDKLPKEAQDYVLFIEKQLGHKINMVSNGPEREAIIYRD